ncbi:MAG: LacI family transcriptional regulator [Clostridiales bacterium]|nr:LacI family transcriptional regulator [Clostridiales bacterium]
MKRKAVSLKDIAKDVGLSVDAVSKALRDSDQISEKTKRLIKKRAEEMGYVKNSSALALKTGRSNSILIFLNSLYNQYFSIMATHLIKEIDKVGYRSTICFTEGFILDENQVSISEASQNAAVISLVEPTDDIVEIFKEKDIPLYIVGIKPKQSYPNYAITDDYSGGYKVGEYFAYSSFKKAAYITNSPSETSYRRRQGFVDAVSSLCNKTYKSFPFDENDNYEQIVDIIHKEKIDFVFCFSDYLGLLLRTLLHKKYRNYETVIFGFDNVSEYIEVFDPLNSVASDVGQIAEDVVEHIISVEHKKTTEKFEKIYPVKLVIKN